MRVQVAFGAEFLRTRIEKERKAVLAEAQMMNTIEYRMDCQLLQYLHEENALGHRFPIGMVDQARSLRSDFLAGCTAPRLLVPFQGAQDRARVAAGEEVDEGGAARVLAQVVLSRQRYPLPRRRL